MSTLPSIYVIPMLCYVMVALEFERVALAGESCQYPHSSQRGELDLPHLFKFAVTEIVML